MDTEDKIAARAGISRGLVDRILWARTAFQFAIGIASPDDDGIGPKIRAKYPDLLRRSVSETAGRSPETPVTHELEATIVQLESGCSASAVVAVIAAEDEIRGVVEPEQTAAYRAWSARWVGETRTENE